MQYGNTAHSWADCPVSAVNELGAFTYSIAPISPTEQFCNLIKFIGLKKMNTNTMGGGCSDKKICHPLPLFEIHVLARISSNAITISLTKITSRIDRLVSHPLPTPLDASCTYGRGDENKRNSVRDAWFVVQRLGLSGDMTLHQAARGVLLILSC